MHAVRPAPCGLIYDLAENFILLQMEYLREIRPVDLFDPFGDRGTVYSAALDLTLGRTDGRAPDVNTMSS